MVLNIDRQTEHYVQKEALFMWPANETEDVRVAEEPIVLLPGRAPEELVLTFAGNIVKHLGVQMYSGRPVPAIAELISNAWDADAKSVEVRLPFGEPWNPGNTDHFI